VEQEAKPDFLINLSS